MQFDLQCPGIKFHWQTATPNSFTCLGPPSGSPEELSSSTDKFASPRRIYLLSGPVQSLLTPAPRNPHSPRGKRCWLMGKLRHRGVKSVTYGPSDIVCISNHSAPQCSLPTKGSEVNTSPAFAQLPNARFWELFSLCGGCDMLFNINAITHTYWKPTSARCCAGHFMLVQLNAPNHLPVLVSSGHRDQ